MAREAIIFEKAEHRRMVDGRRLEWSPSRSAITQLSTRSKLTCPRLGFFIQGELHGDMADSHETGQEALVERAKAFGAVNAGNGVKSIAISGGRRRHYCLRLCVSDASGINLTMKRVLTTHKGFVNTVPVAPALIAATI